MVMLAADRSSDITLRDGRVVRIRPVTPADGELFCAYFPTGLSAEPRFYAWLARYRRHGKSGSAGAPG